MPESRLQSTEVSLTDIESGWAIIEPKRDRSEIQLQMNTRGKPLALYHLSPEEAHSIGHSLVDHAEECGYDADTAETRVVE